jgi:hypothetical protein
MAVIVQQQPTAGSEESAARQFWCEKMDRHRTLADLLTIAGVGVFPIRGDSCS